MDRIGEFYNAGGSDNTFENLYVYGKLNCNSVNDVQISVNGSTLTLQLQGLVVQL